MRCHREFTNDFRSSTSLVKWICDFPSMRHDIRFVGYAGKGDLTFASRHAACRTWNFFNDQTQSPQWIDMPSMYVGHWPVRLTLEMRWHTGDDPTKNPYSTRRGQTIIWRADKQPAPNTQSDNCIAPGSSIRRLESYTAKRSEHMQVEMLQHFIVTCVLPQFCFYFHDKG